MELVTDCNSQAKENLTHLGDTWAGSLCDSGSSGNSGKGVQVWWTDKTTARRCPRAYPLKQ
jgi:hypothetical protein